MSAYSHYSRGPFSAWIHWNFWSTVLLTNILLPQKSSWILYPIHVWYRVIQSTKHIMQFEQYPFFVLYDGFVYASMVTNNWNVYHSKLNMMGSNFTHELIRILWHAIEMWLCVQQSNCVDSEIAQSKFILRKRAKFRKIKFWDAHCHQSNFEWH